MLTAIPPRNLRDGNLFLRRDCFVVPQVAVLLAMTDGKDYHPAILRKQIQFTSFLYQHKVLKLLLHKIICSCSVLRCISLFSRTIPHSAEHWKIPTIGDILKTYFLCHCERPRQKSRNLRDGNLLTMRLLR